MKKTKPTLDQAKIYQALFDYFNKSLFSSELPQVILNLSRGKSNNTRGHFSPERWNSITDPKVELHEINLNPYWLLTGTPQEVCSTLVHEMVHLWQEVYGKPSRSGYHNKQWGSKMEEIGLMPSNTGEPGGKKTGQQMTHYVMEGGAYEQAFTALPQAKYFAYKSKENFNLKLAANSKKSKVKYTCRECGAKAWGKPEMVLLCGACSTEGNLVPMY